MTIKAGKRGAYGSQHYAALATARISEVRQHITVETRLPGWCQGPRRSTSGETTSPAAMTGVIGANLGLHTASGFIGGGQIGCDYKAGRGLLTERPFTPAGAYACPGNREQLRA